MLNSAADLPPDHISHLESYINSMEKLAVNFHNNGEQEVASAFNKFAEFSKELLTPMKNLVRHMELRGGLSVRLLRNPIECF